jgi:Uma2 family endonuclease
MTTRIAPLLTAADLELMPDDDKRYELVEGELLVTRAPGLPHQDVLRNLILLIGPYLNRTPVGQIYPTPGVIFDDYNSVIPDLVFLTNEQRERAGSHIHEAPELAVEIVSPGRENARRDRVVKLQVYSKFKVKEYWVVDPEARTVEVYRLTDDVLALAATLTDDDELTSSVLPGFGCKVSEIFGGR